MSVESDDHEEVPDWGPLTEEEETLEDEFSESLRDFEDEESDLDDQASLDLDHGIALPEDAGDESDGPELPMDFGILISTEEDPSLISGEEFGPPDLDLGSSIKEVASFLDDDAVGTVSIEDMLLGELPEGALSADDGLEGGISEEADDLPGSNDEDPPGHAERPWLEVPAFADREPRSVVKFGTDSILAGGEALFRIDDNDVRHRLTRSLGHEITSVVMDCGSGVTIVATSAGELYRVGPTPNDVELLSGWQRAAESVRSTTVRLGGPTPSARPAILLLVGDGTDALLESTDRGTTFRRVELGGRVLALGAGTPPVCLVETKNGLRLFRGASTGGFTAVGEPLTFDTERLDIASDGDVIALSEPERGVRVSGDGGATFRRAAGTSHVTAIATGRLGARPSAFAALFEPTTGRASLVWIDAVTAEALVIAELAPTMDDDSEDDGSLIRSITWDRETETVWAAGAFGLRRFRRPPSA